MPAKGLNWSPDTLLRASESTELEITYFLRLREQTVLSYHWQGQEDAMAYVRPYIEVAVGSVVVWRFLVICIYGKSTEVVKEVVNLP